MNRNKFNNKKLIILFVILFISIGFALLSTNLNIRGLLGFNSKWDVHLENIQVLNNDIDADLPVLNEDKNSITFGGKFLQPGEIFEFNVDVVNAGTIDTMLNILTKTGIDATNENYLNYTVTYDDNLEIRKYDLLRKDSRVRLKIKAEYKYDIEVVPSLEQQNFSLSLEYVSSTNDAVDRENAFKKSDANNVFTIANAKENSLDNLKIYGNSTQTTYEGKNLYNYMDIYDSSAKLSDDGWITLSSNNVEGTTPVYKFHSTNNLNLNPENKYVVILEVKSVSGSCVIHPTSYYNNYGQLEDHHYSFENLANNKTYYYVASVNNGYIGNNGLRTYISVQPGKSGSITFRLSVIEGENMNLNNFKYEPYVGEVSSPSPEYPQEINSVEGESNLQILGINLFNKSTSYIWNDTGLQINKKTNDSWIVNGTNDVGRNEFRLFGGWSSIKPSFILPKGTYKLNAWIDDIPIGVEMTFGNGKNYKQLGGTNSKENIFTIDDNYYGISSVKFVIPSGTYENSILKVMLLDNEINGDIKEYIPVDERIYPITLGSIELNGIGEFRDYIYRKNEKWYVHKEIEKYTFTGEEHFESLSSGKGNALNKQRFGILDFSMRLINARKQGCLCDIYKGIPYDSGIHTNNIINSTALFDSGKTFAFTTNSETMTLDEFKSSMIGKNYYYVIDTPKEIEISDQNLVNQLNNLLDNNIKDGYNFIKFNSNIETTIEFSHR